MRNNNLIKTVASLAVCLGLSSQVCTAGLFHYSSTTNSFIQFNGDSTFTFTPSSNNLKITDGTAISLLGEITGTYTIGAVTTVGSFSTAPVSGVGTFVVHDGANDLTASLSWIDIQQDGTGDSLNVQGDVNLSGVTYAGSNPDLLALKNAASGINVLAFQFIPAISLDSLKTAPARNSFNGSVAFCSGKIGDFIWNDLNGNGCQDPGEPGIAGVKVDLYMGCGANKGATAIKTTTTDVNGNYLFDGLCAGDYTVAITTPNGFIHTLGHQSCNVGGLPSNQTDSNCECPGSDNCDVCVNLPTDTSVDLTIDCGYIGNQPCFTFVKTADTNSAPAGGQVGYTYALTNCSSAPLTNLAIIDDAGTPGFPADDFTVASGINLLPGQGTSFHVLVNLPVVECVSNSNPSINAGLLITQVLPNGNIMVTYRQSRGLNDNVYGTPAPADGWSSHTFGNLTGSDKAEFRFMDGNGKVVLDFFSDYVSATTSNAMFPSGYASLGPNGGDGSMVVGGASNVVSYTSTLAESLNHTPPFPSLYTVNSPTPEASFPSWDYVDGYTVVIKTNVFGAAGFGSVSIPFVHNSPAKTGNNQVSPVPCGGCITNTASVVTVGNGNVILATIATDDAVVCTGTPTPPPPTCLITEGAFKIDKNTIQIPLKNAGSANIVLSELDLTWNQAVNGKLTKVSLNGDFWTGPSAGSPVALTSGFNADPNRRTIAKGQTKTLMLTFEKPASKVLTDYSGGTVKFGTCVVNFP